MNLRGDEYGALLDVISRATRFMRHYLGEVLDDADSLSRGRVKVAIPEVGWMKTSEAPWVEPEYARNGQVTPAVGAWVVVYFMAADPSRPVYRGGVGEIRDSMPASFTGPTEDVLLDDGVIIKYDRQTKTLSVTGADHISMNGDGKPFVTHAELNSALQGLITALNLHTHPTATPGPPSPPAISMSLDISSAATTTVKTGG